MKFDSLKRQGILSKDYKLGKSSDFSLHTINSIKDSVKLEDNGIVVLDNSEWFAVNGNQVVSHDGKYFGTWDADLSTFFNQSLSDNKLTVRKKQIINIEKESLIMADKDKVQTQTEELESILNDVMEESKAEVKESNAFTGKETETTEATVDVDAEKRKEIISSVIGKVNDDQVKSSELRLKELRGFAHRHGRLEATIVKTNPVVKIFKDKKLAQSAKGEYMFLATGDVADRAAFEASDKKKIIGERKNYQHTINFTYKHYRAGAMTGVVISTPEGADAISLSQIKGAGEIKVDQNKTDLIFKVMPLAYAESYMLSHFGDTIREKHDNDRGFRSVSIERQITTNADGKPIAKTKWKADTKGVPVVSKDNFIPVKVFVTAPLSGSKPEDVTGLRTALTSIVKPEDVAIMTPEAKKFAVVGPDGTYDSPTFKGNGEGIVIKDAYGDKDSKLQGTLRVAVKTGKPSEKDPAKMIYKFQFHELEDYVNGGLSFPAAKTLMERSKLKQDELLVDIKSVSIKNTSSKKVSEDIVSADRFLFLAGDSFLDNPIDFTALEEQFNMNTRLAD